MTSFDNHLSPSMVGCDNDASVMLNHGVNKMVAVNGKEGGRHLPGESSTPPPCVIAMSIPERHPLLGFDSLHQDKSPLLSLGQPPILAFSMTWFQSGTFPC